jgi:hypothetical protein
MMGSTVVPANGSPGSPDGLEDPLAPFSAPEAPGCPPTLKKISWASCSPRQGIPDGANHPSAPSIARVVLCSFMAAPVTTGIKEVDAELARRAPFADAEAAETTAIQLLRVWRAMQPSGDTYSLRSPRTVYRRK